VRNYGLYTAYGAVQQNNQSTTGVDESTGGVYYKASYSYPLYANTSYIISTSGNYSIGAQLIMGLDLTISGQAVFPGDLQSPLGYSSAPTFSGTSLSTTQNGTASYFASPSTGTSSSFGTTSQEFTFNGVDATSGTIDTNLYYRNVEAVNATVVRDYERFAGVEIASHGSPPPTVGLGSSAEGVTSPKAALGRGPGNPKQVLIQGGH